MDNRNVKWAEEVPDRQEGGAGEEILSPPADDFREAGGVSREVWRMFCAAPGEATFHELYRTTSAFIGRICMRITGDEEEAADAGQAVYAQLLEVASQPDAGEMENIDDVIYRLALREADRIRQWKRRRREKDAGAEALEWLQDQGPPADVVTHTRRLQETVTETLEELEGPARRAVQLHYLNGLTHDQVAAELKVSRSAATRLIYRGLREMESRLRAQGITESVVALLLALGAARLLKNPAASWNEGVVYRNARAKQELLKARPNGPGPQGSYTQRALRRFVTPRGMGLGTFGVFLAGLIYLLQPTRPAGPVSGAALPNRSSSSPRTEIRREEPQKAPAANPSRRPRPAGGSFAGRTIGLTGGEPVGQVRAIFEREGRTEAEVLSKSDGRFASPRLPAGAYTVRFEPEAPYGPEIRKATLGASGHDLGDVRLRRFATLRGRVVREGAGAGRAGGIEVRLYTAYDKAVLNTVSASDGTFEFRNLPYPNYKVVLGGIRSLPQQDVEMPDGGEREVEMTLGDIQLTGTVTRAGKPFPGLLVALSSTKPDGGKHSFSAGPEADGSFVFSNVPAGRYTVVAGQIDDPALARQSLTKVVDITETGSRFLELTLPSGRLVGEVADEAGRPVAHASIRIVPAQKQDEGVGTMPAFDVETSSTADGRFAVEGLPPGRYLAVAAGAGGETALADEVKVPLEGDSEPVRLALHRGEGATVRASALDLRTGLPLPGIWCDLATSAGTFRWPKEKGADGSVILRGVPAGDYTLEISAFGYSSHQRPARLSDGQSTDVIAVLHEAGGVKWTVALPDQHPAAGAECLMEPLDEEGNVLEGSDLVRMGRLDPLGVWTARGLKPGRYRFTVQGEKAFGVDEIEIYPRYLADRRVLLEPIPAAGGLR